MEGQHGRDAHLDGVGRGLGADSHGERDLHEAVPLRGVADDVLRLDGELDARAELLGGERRVLGEHLEVGGALSGALEEADLVRGLRGDRDRRRRRVGSLHPRLGLQAREVERVVRAVDDLVRRVVALREVDVVADLLAASLVVVDVREEHRAVLGVPRRLDRVGLVEADLAVTVRVRAEVGHGGGGAGVGGGRGRRITAVGGRAARAHEQDGEERRDASHRWVGSGSVHHGRASKNACHPPSRRCARSSPSWLSPILRTR